ncbi:hypothetical protein DFH28DRAFT_939988 [Melampsora americana]|nr:hypothetical protein DFH28DRAFT_939988 [Melampsora americana]
MSDGNAKTGSSKAANSQHGKISLKEKPDLADGENNPKTLDAAPHTCRLSAQSISSKHIRGSIPDADANLDGNRHVCQVRRNYSRSSSQGCQCQMKSARIGYNLGVSTLASGALTVLVVLALLVIWTCERFPEASICNLLNWHSHLPTVWEGACVVCHDQFEDWFQMIAPGHFLGLQKNNYKITECRPPPAYHVSNIYEFTTLLVLQGIQRYIQFIAQSIESTIFEHLCKPLDHMLSSPKVRCIHSGERSVWIWSPQNTQRPATRLHQ